MYKAIEVWQRVEASEAVRYRCFHVLPNGGYCVQSADLYHVPLNEANVRFLEQQFIELFIEEAPDVRASVYETIEEAIQAFDAEFED